MATDNAETEQVQPKSGYHHGDLREALISAAQQLVEEGGADKFSLADACRLAGVSTAAPYRHFRNREEILAEVTARGFDALHERSAKAVEAEGEGTTEAIVAMGRAYVTFAVEQQALFRLMFGQDPAVKEAEQVLGTGRCCFEWVIQQVAIYCEKNGVEGDAVEIAVRLWTFVHGASSLLIDDDYANVVPDLDVDAMITRATPGLLE
ncbi:MAG: TetR/AcrR family transcriptional regulator [Methyloligellaceae bacterium]